MPAFGTPLLDVAASQVVRAGARRIAVNAHHLAGAVEERVWEVLAPRYPGVQWHVSCERALLGTGGALVKLAAWLGEAPFWVLNADSLFLADLGAMAETWRTASADAAILVSPPGSHSVVANVRVDAAGYVQGLATGGAEGDVAYCGVLLAGPALLDVLARASAPSCLVRQGLVPWIAGGARVLAWRGARWFADTGTPERYLQAHRSGLAHADELRALGVFDP